MSPKNREDELFELDKDKLLSSINTVLSKKTGKNKVFFIWGGEPLLHFESLKKTVEFLKESYPDYKIAFSTNGFLLKEKEIQDFIRLYGLTVQLSVDGVAQNIRSNFNPLENRDVSAFLVELVNLNLLTINCVMHNKNPSINRNIDYFTRWMKSENCLQSKLNIRFTPFNESDMTPDYNFADENLQTFLHEFESLYIHALFQDKRDLVYSHFVKFPLKIVKKSNFERCDWGDSNQCSRFQTGKSLFSKHIDTKGNFLSCNLIDSNVLPRGRTVKTMPHYCIGCEFCGMRGCWPCPAGDFPKRCEFRKKWMQLQQRMLTLKSKVKQFSSV